MNNEYWVWTDSYKWEKWDSNKIRLNALYSIADRDTKEIRYVTCMEQARQLMKYFKEDYKWRLINK